MQLKNIVVLGGSGFVGSALVAKLDAAGYRVKVLTRRRDTAKHLFLLPNVNVESCNIFDDDALYNALVGADAVINLIGILHQSSRLSFDKAHRQLPQRLVNICEALNIKRIVHMSSLGADISAPSQYLQSKAMGEAAITNAAKQTKTNSQIQTTIFKPSIIVGRDDKFINLFATLINLMPAILLAKPQAKFQPIWVEDVATCMVNSLQNTATYGKTYELAGPKVYTFKALIQTIMQTLNVKRPIIGLSDRLSYAQAFMMEWLPIKLMSRDNVKSMEVDSVSNAPFPAVFGIVPTALEAVIPEYLLNQSPRAAYDRFRSHAAR